MKKEVDTVDASPAKRLFASIIADYDLNRSVCELIDNALDLWTTGDKSRDMTIEVDLNKDQQTITVRDNVGGVKKADLKNIVGPGQTGNGPSDETIGIFGVGTKRAVVALAADVTIKTRYGEDKTYQIDFDDHWIEDAENWTLPVYEIDALPPGSTTIELLKLRMIITEDTINRLKEHLRATYAKFLTSNKLAITLNRERLTPLTFENWAYPPKFQPRRYVGEITSEDGGKVTVQVLAGLSKESSPAAGEYGVYFYCNERLVARALKTYEVGFTKGLAGQPHPSISLTRIIVSLKGPAILMPWNSSKSGINTNHHIFIALRNWLLTVVKDYASLSRRLEGDWGAKVFKYNTGEIKEVAIKDFPKANKSYLPQLPKSKPRYADLVTQANRVVSLAKPWTTGLYEGVVAADLLATKKLSQKNRIMLIVLDSTLEIAFKEYLVNEAPEHYGDRRLLDLFKNRSEVQVEIKKYTDFPADLWKKIEYYYNLRCELVHKRVSVAIPDVQIEDFQNVVQTVLTKLFALRF